jgi:hypothetical protein
MRISKFRAYSASKIYSNTISTFSSYKDKAASSVHTWLYLIKITIDYITFTTI